ncbi:MAG: tRNA threonylcarbamoyladenosine dehydratase [Clostridia bacterium]|nr:tRNA threonylcarbamoyladenosine dehydratase [Clostridia bacterium]
MDKSRTALLIGEEGIDKLASKHITIVGCGGVGGYTAVMLARAGVENMTIVDFDEVSSSNVNRQIVAFEDTIGRKKVEVLAEMMQKINKNIKINVVFDKLTEENVSSLIKNTDLVIDAIDSINDKLALIVYCKSHNINIISAMGAGNRSDVPVFEVTDVYKTFNDGLAKVMRKKLKDAGVNELKVVCTKSKPEIASRPVGSISYYPAMCGCTLSAWVINQILEGKI